MALVTNATTGWSSPVTLATDEVWQTRKGSIFVTTTATPAAEDGIALHENHAIRLSAGLSVSYRKAGATEALIVREAV
jgi:hypothetical protein